MRSSRTVAGSLSAVCLSVSVSVTHSSLSFSFLTFPFFFRKFTMGDCFGRDRGEKNKEAEANQKLSFLCLVRLSSCFLFFFDPFPRMLRTCTPANDSTYFWPATIITSRNQTSRGEERERVRETAAGPEASEAKSKDCRSETVCMYASKSTDARGH